jgi:hypothetical protein
MFYKPNPNQLVFYYIYVWNHNRNKDFWGKTSLKLGVIRRLTTNFGLGYMETNQNQV